MTAISSTSTTLAQTKEQEEGSDMSRVARMHVERVFREEHGRILAPLIRILGDFQLAEDAVMEAMVQALKVWPKDGLPDRPAAWIVTCAKNRALDQLRRAKVRANSQDKVRDLSALDDDNLQEPPAGVKDDQLRLIFTCCHPALSLEAQVALTLRTLGGLRTAEIARAFLIAEATMAARLGRAKKKIARAKIPYEIPEGAALKERTSAVLAVLYLVFNEGYAASSGTGIRHDLCREAIRLTSSVVQLLPEDCEVAGLLALMLSHHARASARFDDDGETVLLEDQDRSLFDGEQIERAHTLLEKTLRRGEVGPYQVQAAIALLHARAPTSSATNWREITGLYDILFRMQPTPVVALNRAAAIAMLDGPQTGLDILEEIESDLVDYFLLHAARADLLRRLGERERATEAYLKAQPLAKNESDKRFIERRLRELRAC